MDLKRQRRDLDIRGEVKKKPINRRVAYKSRMLNPKKSEKLNSLVINVDNYFIYFVSNVDDEFINIYKCRNNMWYVIFDNYNETPFQITDDIRDNLYFITSNLNNLKRLLKLCFNYHSLQDEDWLFDDIIGLEFDDENACIMEISNLIQTVDNFSGIFNENAILPFYFDNEEFLYLEYAKRLVRVFAIWYYLYIYLYFHRQNEPPLDQDELALAGILANQDEGDNLEGGGNLKMKLFKKTDKRYKCKDGINRRLYIKNNMFYVKMKSKKSNKFTYKKIKMES